jgi:hypothetical protein
MMDDKLKKHRNKAEFHDDLEGFDIHINEFGEMISNMNIDKINAFLNSQIEDRKLQDNSEEE